MNDTDLRKVRRDIIAELTNSYFESYRYDRPNDTVEQLTAFARDLAVNDVDELLALAQHQLLDELIAELPKYDLIETHRNPVLPNEDIYEAGYNHSIVVVTSLLEKKRAALTLQGGDNA